MIWIRRENIGTIGYVDGRWQLVDEALCQRPDAVVVDWRDDSGRELSAPLTIYFNMTDACQLNCGFCFYGRCHGKRVMDRETIDHAMDYIQAHLICSVDLLGGEPLHPLAADSTLYLMHRLAETDCIRQISMSTNAVNEEGIGRMLAEIPREKLHITVSLQAYHDMSEKNGAIRSIRLLEAAGLPYTIASVMGREIRSLDVMEAFLNTLQVCREWCWYFPNAYITNPGYEKNIPFADEYLALLEQHRNRVPMSVTDGLPPMFRTYPPPKTAFDRLRLRCSGMGSKFEIMPDGGCIPCAILPDEFVTGNINDPDFQFRPLKPRFTSCEGCEMSGKCLYCPGAPDGKRYCPRMDEQRRRKERT